MLRPVLVSACLLGLNTRYNAKIKKCAKVINFLEKNNMLPIPCCPEQLGGLATPRPSCSFSHGDGEAVLNGDAKLFNTNGENKAEQFILGAKQSLEVAKLSQCTLALLKERSPSCGVHSVYQGTQLIAGKGVTTALLSQHEVHILSEENLDDWNN
ncbi:MAG: hypothetical protein BA874_09135 [Desulfuromonadales bacterium C00003068]|nr:MAG: hypothetical protein BA874_09135 [Desulfuromonadales bacterium C00003068]